jgi:Ca2+-binding EF-hand superfamily protein
MQITGVSSNAENVSMQKMMEEMRKMMLKKLDANSDGQINASELAEVADKTGVKAEALIQQYDNDQDGMLNEDEMDAMMKGTRPDGPPPGPPPSSEMSEADEKDDSDLLTALEDEAKMKQMWFKKLDASDDGKIDASELSKLAETTDQSANEIINQYDKNQDGVLNANEVDKMMSEMKPQYSIGIQA